MEDNPYGPAEAEPWHFEKLWTLSSSENSTRGPTAPQIVAMTTARGLILAAKFVAPESEAFDYSEGASALPCPAAHEVL